MANNREFQEHKYDTLSLLAGLTEEDTVQYSLEDILREFGSAPDKKPEENPSGQESELISQIQEAIDHEMEMTSVLPDPVISIEDIQNTAVPEVVESVPAPAASKAVPVPASAKEKNKKTDDSDANDFLSRFGVKIVQKGREVPASIVPDTLPQEKEVLPEEQNADAAESAVLTQPEPATNAAKSMPGESKKQNPVQREYLHLNAADVDDGGLPDDDGATASSGKKEKKKKAAVDTVLPSSIELYHKTQSAVKKGKSLLTAQSFLIILSVIWTLLSCYTKSSTGIFANRGKSSLILFAITTVCMALAWQPVKSGINDLLRMKLSGNAMLVVAWLLNLLAVLFCEEEGEIPACSVLCLAVYYAQWRELLRNMCLRKLLKPVSDPDLHPDAWVLSNHAYGKKQVLLHGTYHEKEFVSYLLKEEKSGDTIAIYSIAVFLATLAGSVLLANRLQATLVWAWSALLSAAIPIGSFISFYRPFSNFISEHSKKGILLAGCGGVEAIASADLAAVYDRDLFPEDKVSLGGVKVYDRAKNIGIAASYASAVMETAESELSGIFRELRAQNQGRIYRVTQFKRYEGGGYGAEVAGDIVLMGSRRFMQLMGIKLKAEADIQGAVYMSLNGTLAAVFVVNYIAAPQNRRSLKRLSKGSGCRPLFATGDFMITPAMVERYFTVPAEKIEFPSAKVREEIRRHPQSAEPNSCAAITSPGFVPFADAVYDANLISSTASLTVVLSMIMSVLSAGVLFFVLLLAEKLTVNAFMVFIVVFICSLPVIIFTGKRKNSKK